MSAVAGCRCLTCRPMLGNGPNYRRPAPLPPRDQWRLSAPAPAEGDRLRPLAALTPGVAVYPPRQTGGA